MKKRIFKKVLSIVLVCVMALTSMGAYSGENSARLHYASNEMGAKLVESEANSSSRTAMVPRYAQKLELTATEVENEWVGRYTLDVYIGNNVDTIVMDGTFELKNLNELALYKYALLEKDAIINGVRYFVIADISKDENSDKLFASISLKPFNATSVSDYIFFSVGDPFITVDMYNSANTVQEMSENSIESISPVQSNNILQEASNSNSADFSQYVYKNQGSTNVGSGDTGAYLKMHYSQSLKRMAVTMSSNAAELIAGVQHAGYASIKPLNFEIGLMRTTNSAVHITRMENPGFDTNNATNPSVLNYLSLITSILGIWNKPAAVASAFVSFLSSAITSNSVGLTEVRNYGGDFSSRIAIDRSYFWDFDNQVMVLEFCLANDGTASFKGYGQINYTVQYIPVGSSYPSWYYINSAVGYTGVSSITK